jgi:hypothetical protein
MAGRLRDSLSRRYRNRRRLRDEHAQRPRASRRAGRRFANSLTSFEPRGLDADHQSWLK